MITVPEKGECCLAREYWVTNRQIEKVPFTMLKQLVNATRMRASPIKWRCTGRGGAVARRARSASKNSHPRLRPRWRPDKCFHGFISFCLQIRSESGIKQVALISHGSIGKDIEKHANDGRWTRSYKPKHLRKSTSLLIMLRTRWNHSASPQKLVNVPTVPC